jgi:hypothetical protein
MVSYPEFSALRVEDLFPDAPEVLRDRELFGCGASDSRVISHRTASDASESDIARASWSVPTIIARMPL